MNAKSIKIIERLLFAKIFTVLLMAISIKGGYKTGEYVSFEYTVPKGTITPPTKKEATIQAKIKNIVKENTQIIFGYFILIRKELNIMFDFR